MGFRRLAPGLLVSDQFKVDIPHPDPCWVLANSRGIGAATEGGKLLVFSTEELTRSFMNTANVPIDEYVPTRLSWDELVDKHKPLGYTGTTVDHKGTAGFYQSVPLEKGI